MSRPADVPASVALVPNQVWATLDSFWRTKVDASDADLIRFQTYASLILDANNAKRSQNFIGSQGIATLEAFVDVPWYPIIVYRDQLSDVSIVKYGEGFDYDPTPQIVYGEAGDPAFSYRISDTFADIPTMYDSITSPTYVYDPSLFSYDAPTRTITFPEDPFTILPSKTTLNREYLILWIRNGKLDLNVPFDQTGWPVKYKGLASTQYVRAIQEVWELDVRGSNLKSLKDGVTRGAGFPAAEGPGQVIDIFSDGYHLIIRVDDTAYTAPAGTVPAVAIGDFVVEGQPLTLGVKFFAGLEAASASSTDLPGIAFVYPLPSGEIIPLYAPNMTLAWSYRGARPSPWRFPIGGEPLEVEAYWTALNVDLSLYYTLAPGDPVNPMALLVSDLWKNAITVMTLDLAEIQDDSLSFVDRARLALSPSSYIILQQRVSAVEDTIDMGASPETIGYGYHATTSDIVSVSGTDLIISDFAPLVTCS